MYICLVKIYCFDFWPGYHILEATGACGMEGEKCDLDQCSEEGVKNQGSCICCRENGWRLWKAITIRSKRVMVSNRETKKEHISEQ